MNLTMVHGVRMKLDENGTKAAAFTVGAMKEIAAFDPKPYKEIILNRPFVYGIISLQDYSPVFLGIMSQCPPLNSLLRESLKWGLERKPRLSDKRNDGVRSPGH